jgi:hypothetical protein
LRGTLSGLPPLRALSKACCGDRVLFLQLEGPLNHSTGLTLAVQAGLGSAVTLSAQQDQQVWCVFASQGAAFLVSLSSE